MPRKRTCGTGTNASLSPSHSPGSKRRRSKVDDDDTSDAGSGSAFSPVRRSARIQAGNHHDSDSSPVPSSPGSKRARTKKIDIEQKLEVESSPLSISATLKTSLSISKRRRSESPAGANCDSPRRGKRSRLTEKLETHPEEVAVPNGQPLKNVIREDSQLWNFWPHSFTDPSNPVLTRKWCGHKIYPTNDDPKRPLSPSNADNGISLNNNSSAGDDSIRVLTYNILSETLLKKSHYLPLIASENYERTTRHKRLMRELDFIQADVLCLQEVDDEYFHNLLSGALKESGYESHLTTNSNNETHGLVFAYRISRFHLLALHSFDTANATLNKYDVPTTVKRLVENYLNEPEVFQIGVLKLRNSLSSNSHANANASSDESGRILCVGNIHVSYARHQKPDVRCVQVTQVLWRITDAMEKFSSPKSSIGWVLCGDFNSTPQSPVYQLASLGYPNDETIEALSKCKNICVSNPHDVNNVTLDNGKASLMDLFWPAFQHPRSDVGSCYKAVLGREPPLTLNLDGNSGCVDYIWYGTETMRPREVLLPQSEYLRDRLDHLPDENMPSDHVSLACSLVFA